MAVYREDIVDIELSSGSIHRSFLNHSIGSGDDMANRFGVRVMRNGEAVNLAGVSCFGYFRNAEGINIALTNEGTVNDNVAYVTLPQACYNVDGKFTLSIKLIGGGVTGTMRIVDGMVDNTNTGGAVAPTEDVPTYTEILAVYEQMLEAVEDYDETVEEQNEKISDIEEAISDGQGNFILSDDLKSAIEEINDTSYINKYLLPQNITDLNNIDTNSVYQVSSDDIANTPTPASYIVITNLFLANASIRTQIIISYSRNQVFYRKLQSGTWSAWQELTGFVNYGLVPDEFDLNTIQKQSIYSVQAGAAHSPVNYPTDLVGEASVVFTVRMATNGSGFVVQFCMAFASGKIRIRGRNGITGTWTEWAKPFENCFENLGALTSSDDLDDISGNSVHSVSTVSQPDNYPMGTRPGIIFTTDLFGLNGYVEQIAIPYDAGSTILSYRYASGFHIRRKHDGEWGPWAFIKATPRNHAGKYFAFGDSTTWGYSADQSHAQSPWNYPFIVGDLTGIDVHNVADPGQGIIKNWNTETTGDAAIIPTIQSMIENGDFDDAVLITVGWAYNDASYYSTVDFGDPADEIPASTTGITTWLGHYAKILEILQKAAPSAVVMLVTGYGYTTDTAGHKTDNQWTKTWTFRDGAKTIRQMYNALEEMANNNGFICINQAKGSAINRVNGSDIIGDNIHPTYDGYRLYGNFVAARIVSAFQNV